MQKSEVKVDKEYEQGVCREDTQMPVRMMAFQTDCLYSGLGLPLTGYVFLLHFSVLQGVSFEVQGVHEWRVPST